ncbi:hypothetical protein [Psychroflexus montanilacus]|uniref:hypothetical protein n=1 Tax=Psychroflexus montanilacus TaxID=2873598 RepID=UPI001CCECD16|nr:hypothetical protein [Psychroflexus montanilacus]MBZ9652789.1 hypothetical protein [Psychroflexus montanilacus]
MKITIILLLLFVNTCFGQYPFLEINASDIQSRWKIQDAYLIEDSKTNSYYAILEEDKVTHGFKFDGTGTLVNRITSEGLKRKYKEIIGHIIKNNKLLLIQKNDKGNKFAYIQYDFITGKTKEAEYDIEKRTDRFVESYCTSDRCIIYTIDISNHNSLKKWEYTIDGTSSVKEIFLTKQLRMNGIKDNYLSSYIIESQGFSSNINLVKVNNKIPNNIEITANPNKMYEYEDGFVWTLDADLEHTILINFDYPEFEPVVRLIKKSELEKNRGTSNSFLFEDKIAQVMSNNRELIVDFKSVENPELLYKTLRVDKKEEIEFKNTPILQEGATYSFGGTRKLEKTSKLLRKMSSQDNGISVNKNDDHYHITIGGKRKQNSGGGMMMPGFGAVPMGAFGAMTTSFNPTFFAYGVYSNTGSTRIECLFDQDLNHVEGEITKNVFDRIDDYKEVNERNIKVESITYFNNRVILGYLSLREDRYLFKSFEL